MTVILYLIESVALFAVAGYFMRRVEMESVRKAREAKETNEVLVCAAKRYRQNKLD